MIFDRKIKEERDITVNDWNEFYSATNGYTDGFSDSLGESTYFNCLKVISESVAKCTIQVRKDGDLGETIDNKHYLTEILRLRPNNNSNAVDLIKTFVTISKHNGIGGLFIDRNGGKVKGLYPVEITGITIDNVGLIKSKMNNKVLYEFRSVGGEIGSCFEKDIIILRDFTLDGINAKATRKVLKESLETSKKSQNYLNNLFKNGLTNKLIVQMTSDIKEEKELKKIQGKFDRLFSNNGRVFTVPAGYSVSALNLSLADAQFAELRKLSKEEIASAMGVPLSKLGIQVATAKTLEQENLQFLIDTLQVIFASIEQELDYKLLTSAERMMGYKIRFNVNTILRMDSVTQAQVIDSYVKNGVYDLDYAKGLLGVEKIGGDKIITLPSGQVLLKDLLAGKVSYQNNKNANGGSE